MIIERLRKKCIAGSISIYFLVVAVSMSLRIANASVSILDILPVSVMAMMFGRYTNKKRLFTASRNRIFIISICVFGLFVYSNYIHSGYSFDLSSLTIGNPVLYIGSSLAGTIALYEVTLQKKSIHIINWIGRNSLYFYGLHFAMLGIVKKILPYGGDSNYSNNKFLFGCDFYL